MANPLFSPLVNAVSDYQWNERNKIPSKVPDGPRPYDFRSSSNALTAAAEVIDLSSKSSTSRLQERTKDTAGWQKDAYQYYKLIPEVHRTVNMISRIVSKANLYVGVVTDTSSFPSPISQVPDDTVDSTLKSNALSVLRAIENSANGTSGFLYRMATSLQIAGECFIVEEPQSFPFVDGKTKMYVRSVSELEFKNDSKATRVSIKSSPTAKEDELKVIPTDNFMVRSWTPDPEYYVRPDSPMNGVLDQCEQHLLLLKAERVATRSALNASVLFIPSELKTQAEEEYDEALAASDPDSGVEFDIQAPNPLEQELMDAMSAPIEDESSASSVVPFIIRGPAEQANYIRYIPIDRPDNNYTERADASLRRILNGLDIPPEVVNSMLSNLSQNVFSDDLYLQTIEPMIMAICENLTQGVLRRILISKYNYTPDEVANLVVWFDPSAITAKPNRREASDFGFSNHIISADAWRRDNGYSESDAPSELEKALRIVEAKGILNEEVTARSLSANFPTLFNGLSTTTTGIDESGFNKQQSQPPSFLAEPSQAPSKGDNPEILFDREDEESAKEDEE